MTKIRLTKDLAPLRANALDRLYTASGRKQATITSFDRFRMTIPLGQRVRYALLTAGLKHDDDFRSLCRKIGLKCHAMRQFFFDEGDVDLRTISDWAFACDARIEVSAFDANPAGIPVQEG